MAKSVTLVLNMLETWFWCLTLGFWDQRLASVAKMAICGHFGVSPFSYTSDLPEYGHLGSGKMAKLVTLVLNMLVTWFWCLSLGFWLWEIHWDCFQTPQIGLSGQNGHFEVSQSKIKWPNLQLWFWTCNIIGVGQFSTRISYCLSLEIQVFEHFFIKYICKVTLFWIW